MATARPNILLLITDEQRRDSLGCYGSPWAHTPHIDALAKDGIVCESALTPAPVCVPARTSLFTARYPSQTGVWSNRTDMTKPRGRIMDCFKNAGYHTAYFGKSHCAGGKELFEIQVGPTTSPHVGYFKYAPQYDEAQYDVVKYPGSIYPWIFGGRFPAPASETGEAKVVECAKEWFGQAAKTTPFFASVSFNGPHTPVVPPEPFDRIIPADRIQLPAESESLPAGSPRWLAENLSGCATSSVLSPEQKRRMRQYYYGEVAYLDSLFGEFLEWMKGRGLLDNTIVVYWADHGTHLGDYGLVQKQTFFEPVVNVPFIFWHPSRLPRGARIKTPVESQSLLPTLLDLVGVENTESHCSPSLAQALLAGSEPTSRPVFSELTLESFSPRVGHSGRLVMVREGPWKYSACLDPEFGDDALYNLESDPLERVNLARTPECEARRKAMQDLIDTHIADSARTSGKAV